MSRDDLGHIPKKYRGLKTGAKVICTEGNKIWHQDVVDCIGQKRQIHGGWYVDDTMVGYEIQGSAFVELKSSDKVFTLRHGAKLIDGRCVVNINGILYYAGFFTVTSPIKRKRSIFLNGMML